MFLTGHSHSISLDLSTWLLTLTLTLAILSHSIIDYNIYSSVVRVRDHMCNVYRRAMFGDVT